MEIKNGVKYNQFKTSAWYKVKAYLVMAKTLEQLPNKLRIKYLVKYKKYFLFYGSGHIIVDGVFLEVFETFEKAKEIGNDLKHKGRGYYTSK